MRGGFGCSLDWLTPVHCLQAISDLLYKTSHVTYCAEIVNLFILLIIKDTDLVKLENYAAVGKS